MDDYAGRAARRSANDMNQDPISIAGFRHGMGLCRDEYIAVSQLTTRMPVKSPEGLPNFHKALVALATACWRHRVNHRDLLQEVAASKELDEPLLPWHIIDRSDGLAEKLSKRPWRRNEVSAKIESEILGLKLAMVAADDGERDDEEIFTSAIKDFQTRADMAYVMAMINGYGELASEALPAAVWAFRVHPLRQKIFQEMMQSGVRR